MKITIIIAFLLSGFWAQANKNYKDKVAAFVPQSKIVTEEGNEFEVLTADNTAIEIELNKDGSIDEASGDAADRGDLFVPGSGHIPLAEAVASLKKSGKTPSGDWSYDKSLMNGWVYEFEGHENGKKMKYIMSAKDGKIIKERRDW